MAPGRPNYGNFQARLAGHPSFHADRRRIYFCPLEKNQFASVTEIILYLGTPSLVFSSLVSKPLIAGDILILSIGIVGAPVRSFGSFAAANIAVNLIGAEGVNRQVLLLYGALPAAVINFVLTEKYRQDPALAASIVVISTFVSILTIPVVFWLIL